MSNHSTSVPNAALDARRVVAAGLRERAADVPPSPFEWSAFDPADVVGTAATTLDERLATLQRQLCTAAARSAELRGLWTESVMTAAFAWRIAPRLAGDAASAAIAGLLHRLGDILTIRAIAAIEQSAGVRLDAPGKAELCAEIGVGMLDRTLRDWRVPARAATTAAEWRRLRDFPEAAADATAVHLGRLFALELIAPQFCAPGAVDSAAREAGLKAGGLSALRADDTIPRLLVSLR